MYPNLYYFFKEVFGAEIGVLRFINSFGFFVALSFLIAAALLSRELERKSKQGLFKPTKIRVRVGEPASVSEMALNFILGFILGFKILALFFLGSEATRDPQAYIFSGKGSWPAGLALGALFAWLKWREKKKTQLAKPEEREVWLWPKDRVGEITVIALVFGLIGAKMFDIFENWGEFMKNPIETIFSGGGLTFYGGLICATIAIVIYARKHGMSLRYLADSLAPALMIAYAVGRIGCQVAGDGDWGIYNSAFKVDPVTNEIVAAQPAEFDSAVVAHGDFFLTHPNLEHTAVAPGALGFLPNWFFAYNYPHNVNEVGVPINGCTEKYCNQLPVPVFPTPFYETLACTLLFLLLWALRKRMGVPGALFALYLFLNGMERFLIEKIRVNNKMNFLGMHPTQAEVIATGLMLTGIVLWFVVAQKNRARA